MAQLTVVATLKARAGREEALLSLLQGLIGPTRAEQGCVRYELHRSDEEPGTFLFDETWESRALWEAHMRSPHLVAFGEAQDEVTESWALFSGHRLGGGV